MDKYFKQPVEKVVVWMHSSGKDNFKWLMNKLRENKTQVYHISGSSAYKTYKTEEIYNRYYRIILGQHEESSGLRWHTNAEISEAVLTAMTRMQTISLVGNFENL
jgi:chromatin segregation and condensation protein Rec8/ScpA/Scc1 (kleisin family)